MILEPSHLIFRSSTSKRRVAFGGIVQWSQGTPDTSDSTTLQWKYACMRLLHSFVPRLSHRPVFDCLQFLHTISDQKLDGGTLWNKANICTITTRDVASNEAEKPVASSLCARMHTHIGNVL